MPLIVLVIIVGLFVKQRFIDSVNLPKGEAQQTTVEIKNGDEFVTLEVMETDGLKHSVPLEDILGGGPPRDGIPSIDNPSFYSVVEAERSDEVADEEPGILIDMEETARFYPYNILVWHEIVNDTINGQRVLVTYCPLCLSGIVFDPLVDGERVDFGTSGKLWNSNLVMYDRKTESLWSQVLGEGIVGEQTGVQLTVLPSDRITFGAFKEQFPHGEVLTRDTGSLRSYGQDPYGDYYTDNSRVIFPVDNKDTRLENKDYVLGIIDGDFSKAYLPSAIKRDMSAQNEVVDRFAGRSIILRYDADLDVVRMFEKLPDGTEERINPFPNFWFSWVAAHPETDVYK